MDDRNNVADPESCDGMGDNKQISDPGIVHYDDDDEGERGQTFRQRRLTYSNKHLLEALQSANLQGLEEDDDKEEKDYKEKTQRSHSTVSDDTSPPSETKEQSVTAEDTKDQIEDKKKESFIQLKSRILHASAPPIPKGTLKRDSSFLYLHHNKEECVDDSQTASESQSKNKVAPSAPSAEWKKRRHTSPHAQDDTLPFPRRIVGTYSCHGIEPVYDEADMHSNLPACVAKINQDRGGVAFPYANCSRMALFAAYDGHGEGGEHVAQYALHEIPKRLEQHEDFLNGDIEKAFQDVFVNVDRDLASVQDIEPAYSGCTACVVLMMDNKLYLANAGDSRAVMGCRSKGNGKTIYKALDLTVDQNPDSPGEQERIEKMGGFVSPPPEVGLSARVWLDYNHSQIGLAMSRSLGDHAVKSIGVIATPVVSEHEISANDAFLVIATDGVWEFLTSQQVVNMISQDLESGKGASEACQNLIEAAAAMWHEHEGDYRDDITALVIKVQEVWEDKR